MLSRRLGSAAVLIGGLLLIIWLDFWLGTDAWAGRPGLLLSLLAIVCAGWCAAELSQLIRGPQTRLHPRWAVLSTVLMVAIGAAPVVWRDYPVDCPVGYFGWALIGLAAGIGSVFLVEMATYNGRPGVIDRVSRYGFGLLYLLLLFDFLIAHRLFRGDNSLGLVALIGLITTVKLSDAAAYFVGKSMGRHKLAPRLSPKKTVEGALGGLIGGCAGTAFVLFVVAPGIFQIEVAKAPWWWVVYGVSVTIAGMLGDLAESLLKRDAALKDSGQWLPGLGGILDVVDSLVFAAPVSYFLWTLGDLAPH